MRARRNRFLRVRDGYGVFASVVLAAPPETSDSPLGRLTRSRQLLPTGDCVSAAAT
jgi:hypothetical protein